MPQDHVTEMDHRRDTIWHRIVTEARHWLRSEWSLTEVGAHWDATEDYDEINERTYTYFRRFSDAFRFSDLPDRAVTLDFCARTGNGSKFFFEQGKIGSLVCADVSFRMGQICIQQAGAAGIEPFVWVPVTDYRLPFGDNKFDLVLCFETLEHFAAPERFVHEFGRITKPGGKLVVTTPNLLWEPVHALAAITGAHHSEGPHRFIRYARLLDMIMGNGFQIERVETTILVPGGPRVVLRLGEWIEQHAGRRLMRWLGLRRIVVSRKL